MRRPILLPAATMRSLLLLSVLASPLLGQTKLHEFANWCVGIGDVNRDGYDDLVELRPLDGPNGKDSGAVAVRSGKDASLIGYLPGDAAGDRFGGGATALADVDSDGHADFAVAASSGGYVKAFSGKTLAIIYATPRLPSSGAWAEPLEDIDSDGIPEFSVTDSSSQARILSGRRGKLLFVLPNTRIVAALGDVSGDGIPDVGARDSKVTNTWHFVSGRDWRTFRTITLVPLVRGLEDTNSDGYADYVVTPGVGEVQVRSGRDDKVLLSIKNATVPYFGVSDIVGDFDSDGLSDIGIGGRGVGGVYSSRTGKSLATLKARSPQGSIGIWRARDLNGDHTPDVWINDSSSSPAYYFASVKTYPLATSTHIGQGCGRGSTPPRLESSLPRLAFHATLIGAGTEPQKPVIVFLSTPTSNYLKLGSGCTLYLDVQSLFILSSATSNAAGTWWTRFVIPAPATFAGTKLHLQAVVAGTRGPRGFDLTNGLGWTFGY